MTVFVCEPGYEGILSCIYDAGMSKIPQDELRLEIKNSGQNVELFSSYVECVPSSEKVKKVMETVRRHLNSNNLSVFCCWNVSPKNTSRIPYLFFKANVSIILNCHL